MAFGCSGCVTLTCSSATTSPTSSAVSAALAAPFAWGLVWAPFVRALLAAPLGRAFVWAPLVPAALTRAIAIYLPPAMPLGRVPPAAYGTTIARRAAPGDSRAGQTLGRGPRAAPATSLAPDSANVCVWFLFRLRGREGAPPSVGADGSLRALLRAPPGATIPASAAY